ncbi:hypothetical protein POV27_11605 [Aureisphaera galaxeae]|uniref:anti-sigma factor family protein n=1 Tax=Aureisphaera galaxeae TaxID=1538023 RepID=UPI00234FD64D|nr:hypothetical protein [Aureisphaera galaxeae]MDC8004698.1 hypothetical protein [Aureisphaera galaxeae]
MEHIDDLTLCDYLSGECDNAIAEQVKAHIEACSFCKEKVEHHQALNAELSKLPSDGPSLSFSNNVIDRIEKDRAMEESSQFWFNFTRNTIYFSILLAIGCAFLLMGEMSISIDAKWIYKVAIGLLVGAIISWAFYGLDRLMAKKRSYP